MGGRRCNRVGRLLFVTQVGRDFSMFLCCREGDCRELKLLVHAGGLANTTKACGRKDIK